MTDALSPRPSFVVTRAPGSRFREAPDGSAPARASAQGAVREDSFKALGPGATLALPPSAGIDGAGPAHIEPVFRVGEGNRIVGAPQGPALFITSDGRIGPPMDLRALELPYMERRPKGYTELAGIFEVERNRGVRRGDPRKNRNPAKHLVLDGRLTALHAIRDPSVVDTFNVRVALRLASEGSKHPNGLPRGVFIHEGDQLEVEGEYIPAALAGGLTTPEGEPSGVLHFTHAPLGYVVVDGQKYA